MTKHLKTILFAIFTAVLLVSGYLYQDYQEFLSTPFSINDKTLNIDISPGRSLKSVAKELADKNIISHARYLEWVARVRGDATQIQAGEYVIASGILPEQFLDRLVKGDVVQYSFTIIEGWNTRQLLDAIKTDPNLVYTLQDANTETLPGLIGLNGIKHAEGQFLPETYNFIRGDTDASLLRRANRALQQELESAWQAREKNLPYSSMYDALIMASIVEKETGQANERGKIAGVFVRRLKKGMRLQTDPTVIYGIGDSYDGNIRRRDLKTDTPYNTYTRKGLPPTPIAMPGRAAIHAALHPEQGKELYFVSRGDGSHVFSSTLDEHNNAVIKYQLKGRRKAFSSFTNNSTQNKAGTP